MSDLRVKEILDSYGLDFRIDKIRQTIPYGDKTLLSPYYGLVNSKTEEVIHSVKKGYIPTQNEEVVRGVLEGMKPFGDKLRVSNAGALAGGKRIFVQLEIEGTSKVGDDTIKRYVTIIDSNDGSSTLRVGIGDYTMSCSNQYQEFKRSAKYRFRHNSKMAENILELPNLIAESLDDSLQRVKLYNKLASTPLTKGLADQLVNYLLGHDRTCSVNELADLSTQATNTMDKLYDNIGNEIAQKGNNLWGLHSGVTRFTTHDKSVPKRANGRTESILTGGGYKMNQKSLEFAVEHI
jgi:hypothetical protein